MATLGLGNRNKFLVSFSVALFLMMSLPVLASSDAARSAIPAIIALLLDDSEPVVEPEQANVFALVEASSFLRNEAEITWIPTSDAVTPESEIQYTIFLATNEAFPLSSATLTQNAVGTSFATVTGLEPSTQYFVKVTAENADGQISLSNEISFATPENDVLVNPSETVMDMSSVGVDSVSENEVTLIGAVAPDQGDIVVSANVENPYLRRVVSSSTGGGTTVVTTEPVGLVEVFEDFALNTNIRLESLPDNPPSAQNIAMLNQFKGSAVPMLTKAASSPIAKIKTWPNGLTMLDNSPNKQLLSYKPTQNKISAVNSVSNIQSNDTTMLVSEGRYLRFSVPEFNVASLGELLDAPIVIETHNTCGAFSIFNGCTSPNVTPVFCGASLEIIGFPLGVNFDSIVSSPVISSTIKGTTSTSLTWLPTSTEVGTGDDPYYLELTFREGTEEQNCEDSQPVVVKSVKVYLEQGDHALSSETEVLASASAEVAIQNEIVIDFEPSLTVDVQKEDGALRVDTAKVSFSGRLNLRQEFNVDASASGSVSARRRIAERTFVRVFTAGPVPIFVAGTMRIDLAGTATAEGRMNLTEVIDDTFQVNFGAIYENREWRSDAGASNTLTLSLSGSANAQLGLDARLIVDFELSFYEAATARLLVEPFLFSDFGINGEFNFEASIGQTDFDRNYSLTQFDAGYGVDASLFAGLSIFEREIITFPSSGTFSDTDTYQMVNFIPRTPILRLPELALNADPSTAFPLDSRALRLEGSAVDFVSTMPLPFSSGDPIVSFSDWLGLPNIISTESQCTGNIVADERDSNVFWYTPEQFGDCRFRLAGFSNIGRYARQTTETSFNITDADNNNIPDYWQQRFNLNDLSQDSDGDGLIDADEYANATNPLELDTDQDGVGDNAEIILGTDPNDPNSVPNTSVISISSASMVEGDSGDTQTLVFNLNLNSFLGVVTVDYQTADGTATAGLDYLASSGQLSFIGGQTQVTLPISILGDGLEEGNETFSLILSNPSGAIFNGNVDQIIVEGTIIDNDMVATGPLSPLNDTGITFGGNFPSGNNLDCSGESIAIQDCSHGRDATNNDDSDGHAGFSFTKLDENGNDLPASASNWSCVRDNVTQRIWEVKTNTTGLHNTSNTYTWYDTNPATNGGANGTINGGSCTGSSCDTQGFKAAVNQASLCGYNDWRVPTVSELQGIVNYNRSSPAIDTTFFPNTRNSSFWSASPRTNFTNNAWTVSFSNGSVGVNVRSILQGVRLVRGGQ